MVELAEVSVAHADQIEDIVNDYRNRYGDVFSNIHAVYMGTKYSIHYITTGGRENFSHTIADSHDEAIRKFRKRSKKSKITSVDAIRKVYKILGTRTERTSSWEAEQRRQAERDREASIRYQQEMFSLS